MLSRATDTTLRASAFSFFILSLAACGETGPSVRLPAATVTNATGVALVGPAGQPLPNLVVIRVTDAGGSELEGVTVTFAVTAGGGSATPTTAVTDGRGEARTRWTLGTVAGNNVLSATAQGGAAALITAVGTAGRAAAVAVSTGSGQTAEAGTAVPLRPTVIVRDASNNPVEGVSVLFTVLTGGGQVTEAVARTNPVGLASVGSWILGATTGTQTLAAQVAESGVANNPVLFTATALAGAPASVSAASPVSQSAPAGGLVTSPPSALVRDARGNPVPNATVTFTVASGGGTIVGQTQVTNAQGIATVTSWRLGGTAGNNTATASVSGLTPVTFGATGTAGAAAAMIIVAGDAQTAPINRPVPIAPEVVVRDLLGNGVPGVTVTFAATGGGGVAVSGRQVTGSDGRAAVGAWFLGPAPGQNTLVASSPGLLPVTFTAAANAGPPVSMQAVSLTQQSGIAGQPVGNLPQVVV
ncbi:MAG: Ig-like domain-containing protein, partial [Gemmatimonadaceae bacterium]